MPSQFTEGELEFDFSAALSAENLDAGGQRGQPTGMKLVDFVVKETDRTLLIEVKDPSEAGASPAERAKFAKAMRQNTLISEVLVPKARGSYTFLHLMKRDDNPFLSVGLLGLDTFTNEAALLLGFKDRLLKRIRHEGKEAWVRQYVTDCVVVTTTTWPDHFPAYPLTRT